MVEFLDFLHHYRTTSGLAEDLAAVWVRRSATRAERAYASSSSP